MVTDPEDYFLEKKNAMLIFFSENLAWTISSFENNCDQKYNVPKD